MTTEPERTAEPNEGGAAPPGSPRRLTRSRTDRVLGGVAGGLGEYFGVDPVLVRVGWVLLFLAGGTGLLLYVIAWIIIPEAEPRAGGAPTAAEARDGGTTAAVALAVVLIAIGVFALLRSIDVEVPSWRLVVSVLLGLVGVALVVQARSGLNGGLVFLGAILTVVLAGTGGTVFDLDLEGSSAFGDARETPMAFDELDDRYGHAFGSFRLDLDGFDASTLPRGTTRIEVDVAFGSVQIDPGDVPARVQSDSIFGSGEDCETPDYDDADRKVLIEVSTAFGSSSVGGSRCR